jgi:hypothetical protein
MTGSEDKDKDKKATYLRQVSDRIVQLNSYKKALLIFTLACSSYALYFTISDIYYNCLISALLARKTEVEINILKESIYLILDDARRLKNQLKPIMSIARGGQVIRNYLTPKYLIIGILVVVLIYQLKLNKKNLAELNPPILVLIFLLLMNDNRKTHTSPRGSVLLETSVIIHKTKNRMSLTHVKPSAINGFVRVQNEKSSVPYEFKVRAPSNNFKKRSKSILDLKSDSDLYSDDNEYENECENGFAEKGLETRNTQKIRISED